MDMISIRRNYLEPTRERSYHENSTRTRGGDLHTEICLLETLSRTVLHQEGYKYVFWGEGGDGFALEEVVSPPHPHPPSVSKLC